MKVSEVMTREVEFVPADATVREAATAMAEHDIGAVLVGSAEQPEGILTDRDIILRVVVEGRDLTDLRVRDAMSSTLFTCRADDPVQTVAREMEERQVRRLPVVGEDGAVVGIVVRSDLVRAIAEEPKTFPADEPEPAPPFQSRR
ncbi:MAG TPA: CBS domain-containing protein [Geminicoccaceae bacterium]|nr:CBS domain-containing protein [Geminicoccaceae bacterium]